MNKEQLRKELEDCWKAGCNAMLYDLGHTATNHPNRDTYIKSRLAALDDGLNYSELKEKSKKFLTIESVKQWIAEHPGEFKDAEDINAIKNLVDDGQEGNDERKKHEGVARTFRALDVLAEQLHTTKKLLQEYKKEISDGAALPVADGEGEKVGLPKFLVIKDDNGTFEIWDKNRYETYVKKATDYGATPAVKIIAGFNGNEDFLFPLPSAGGVKWVELKEGNPLPDYDDPVLWLHEDGNMHVDSLDKDGNPWIFGEEFEGFTYPKATHWMPLPTEPEGQPAQGKE